MIVINVLINSLFLMYFLLKNKGSSVFNRHSILRFLILVAFGIGAFLVTAYFESLFTTLMSVFFAGSLNYVNGVLVWYSKFLEISYYFIYFFFVANIVEELAKILPAYFYSENFLFGKTALKRFDFIIPFLIVGLTISVIENGMFFYKTSNNLVYLRILTQFSSHILWALLIGEAYFRYSVKAYANKIYNIFRSKDVPDIKAISGMKPKKMFKLSCVIIMFIHGLFEFLVYNFPIIGLVFIGVSLVCCIIFIIKIKNSHFKETSIKRFLKDNNQLTYDEVKLFLELTL